MLDATGSTVVTGLPDPADPTIMRAALPTLGAGAYEVQWTSVAEDADVERGTFRFTIAAPTRSRRPRSRRPRRPSQATRRRRRPRCRPRSRSHRRTPRRRVPRAAAGPTAEPTYSCRSSRSSSWWRWAWRRCSGAGARDAGRPRGGRVRRGLSWRRAQDGPGVAGTAGCRRPPRPAAAGGCRLGQRRQAGRGPVPSYRSRRRDVRSKLMPRDDGPAHRARRGPDGLRAIGLVGWAWSLVQDGRVGGNANAGDLSRLLKVVYSGWRMA